MRPIDADKLLDDIKQTLCDPNMPMFLSSEIRMIIDTEPTVCCDNGTGKWIKITNTLYKCDQCGAVQTKGVRCKDCNTEMDGEVTE